MKRILIITILLLVCVFFIKIYSQISTEVVAYSSQEVYDCSGQKLFLKATEDPAPAGWNEFFAANELVGIIWEIKKD